MADLSQLHTDTAAQTGAKDSTKTLLGGIAQHLRELLGHPNQNVAINALASSIEDNKDILADAVVTDPPAPEEKQPESGQVEQPPAEQSANASASATS